MEKLFPGIETLEDVLRLARGGGIAGLIFAALTLLDGLLAVYAGGPAVRGPLLSGGPDGLLHMAPLIGTAIEIAAILFMTWRIWTGKGYVSAVLLMALFVAEAMTEIHGGIYGLGWVIAYFVAGLMMLNAIRACIRYPALSTAPLESGIGPSAA